VTGPRAHLSHPLCSCFTLAQKLRAHQYPDVAHFTDDIDLIETNCRELYGADHRLSVTIDKITRAAYDYMEEEKLLGDVDDLDVAGDAAPASQQARHVRFGALPAGGTLAGLPPAGAAGGAAADAMDASSSQGDEMETSDVDV
jgi:hypothetical protein